MSHRRQKNASRRRHKSFRLRGAEGVEFFQCTLLRSVVSRVFYVVPVMAFFITFMQVSIGSAYFPKVTDQLRYYTEDKVLFRFVRQR